MLCRFRGGEATSIEVFISDYFEFLRIYYNRDYLIIANDSLKTKEYIFVKILFSPLLVPFFNYYPQEFQQDDVERLLCVSRDNGVVLEEENTEKENVTSKKGRVNEISEQQRLCQLHKDGISAKFYNFHQPIHFRVPPRFSNTRKYDLFITPKRGKQFRETPFSAESNIPWSLYTPGSGYTSLCKA